MPTRTLHTPPADGTSLVPPQSQSLRTRPRTHARSAAAWSARPDRGAATAAGGTVAPVLPARRFPRTGLPRSPLEKRGYSAAAEPPVTASTGTSLLPCPPLPNRGLPAAKPPVVAEPALPRALEPDTSGSRASDSLSSSGRPWPGHSPAPGSTADERFAPLISSKRRKAEGSVRPGKGRAGHGKGAGAARPPFAAGEREDAEGAAEPGRATTDQGLRGCPRTERGHRRQGRSARRGITPRLSAAGIPEGLPAPLKIIESWCVHRAHVSACCRRVATKRQHNIIQDRRVKLQDKVCKSWEMDEFF